MRKIFLFPLACLSVASKPEACAQSVTNFAGLSTNSPAVFKRYEIGRRNGPGPDSYSTNLVFDHFFPESLNHAVFTNLLARTNGRVTKIWSERVHPPGWPGRPPLVRWETNGLMWGMAGLTGLSPCWEVEGAPGQVPVTALTRRHGYTRGHSFGTEGFHDVLKGRKVWFLALNNKPVEVKVLREVVRCNGQADYTILLFDRDLPVSIRPLRVAAATSFYSQCPWRIPAPLGVWLTEQTGNVSAGIPGFTVSTGKGGDSGSPNLLPLRNELIFVGGRTTSGPGPGMQADMDELCRKEKLDPSKYQMRWADLSAYPVYNKR